MFASIRRKKKRLTKSAFRIKYTPHAEVAELADALGSGLSGRKVVRVQVPPSAPNRLAEMRVLFLTTDTLWVQCKRRWTQILFISPIRVYPFHIVPGRVSVVIIQPVNRLDLFPDTTEIKNNTLTIAGLDLATLAKEYGTPLYLYDRATLDNAVTVYRSVLEGYGGGSGLTYAGKAFLCLAIAEWTQQHGLWLDCTGFGEIAIAVAVGVPKEHILVHGVNKSIADLEAAVNSAGTIVVDNLTELTRLVELSHRRSLPDLWLRLQPGLAVDTHAYTQTNGLPVRGLHFHQGSQFREPAPLGPAIETALDLAEELRLERGWVLSPGGGWGVAYHEDDLPQPDVAAYVRFVTETVKAGCARRGLDLPRLHLEPGRSLVARSGSKIWILLDGGLADNPRPALYGARYSALPVRGPGRPVEGPVSFAGPYCESGDVLIESLAIPEVHEGDVIAVPVSGAYQISMSSNYNGARRPAILWLENGHAQIIRKRETADDLFRHDRRLVKEDGTG
jgi:diaminopimelate decarboxylase